MERLTIQDEKIEGGTRRHLIDARAVKEEAMAFYWALKKYEDTGLEPGEVTDLAETLKSEEMTVDDVKELIYLRKRYEDDEYDYCGEYGTEHCPIEAVKGATRRCEVKTVIPKSKRAAFPDEEWKAIPKSAAFHMFSERSYPVEPSPMMGGHPGGVIKYPVAVVEYENGQIAEVEANKVRFID